MIQPNIKQQSASLNLKAVTKKKTLKYLFDVNNLKRVITGGVIAMSIRKFIGQVNQFKGILSHNCKPKQKKKGKKGIHENINKWP